MRKPGEGGEGSGAVGKKGGKGRKRVKTGDGKTGGKVKRVQASQQNVVPFDVFDRVLCVGEGEFCSFFFGLFCREFLWERGIG